MPPTSFKSRTGASMSEACALAASTCGGSEAAVRAGAQNGADPIVRAWVDELDSGLISENQVRAWWKHLERLARTGGAASPTRQSRTRAARSRSAAADVPNAAARRRPVGEVWVIPTPPVADRPRPTNGIGARAAGVAPPAPRARTRAERTQLERFKKLVLRMVQHREKFGREVSDLSPNELAAGLSVCKGKWWACHSLRVEQDRRQRLAKYGRGY